MILVDFYFGNQQDWAYIRSTVRSDSLAALTWSALRRFLAQLFCVPLPRFGHSPSPWPKANKKTQEQVFFVSAEAKCNTAFSLGRETARDLKIRVAFCMVDCGALFFCRKNQIEHPHYLKKKISKKCKHRRRMGLVVKSMYLTPHFSAFCGASSQRSQLPSPKSPAEIQGVDWTTVGAKPRPGSQTEESVARRQYGRGRPETGQVMVVV